MATVVQDHAEGLIGIRFTPSAWDALIPYRADDVKLFTAGDSGDIAVQQVRLERDRRATFTADVFLYDPTFGRRLVLQFLSVHAYHSPFGAVIRIETPPAFVSLRSPVLSSVGRAIEITLRDLADRPRFNDRGHVTSVQPWMDCHCLE